jgi:hypothetical protein
MNNKRSSILPDSKKGDNIFDKYYTYIEKQKLQDRDNIDFEYLDSSITIIERNLIDLLHENSASKVLIESLNNTVQDVLSEWYAPLHYFSSDKNFVSALAYNFFGLSLVIHSNNWLDNNSLRDWSAFFSPSTEYKEFGLQRTEDKTSIGTFISQIPELKYKVERPISLATLQANHVYHYPHIHSHLQTPKFSHYKIFNRLETNLFQISISELSAENIEKTRIRSVQYDVWELINNYCFELYDSSQVVWDIRIKTSDNNPDAVKFFELLHHFSAALQLIDDQIEVKLEDWGNGSKWASIKVTIKDYFSREDVKSILDKAFDSADAQLIRKPIAEADKVEAEVAKVQKETANLKSKEQAFESEELDLHEKRLRLVKTALEAEDQLLDNKLKAIQVATQLSAMITSGLVKNDSAIEIEINGLLAYKPCELIKSKMSEIANREAVGPKLTTPDSPAEESI